ncbi:MAG TPA: ABC transporter ATP-binding protein [Micromonosporaceae bacterium]|nr:ABC transporter ATP-binding protein [Micromonosporaceae bacterium]
MTTQQPRVLPANAGSGNPPQPGAQPLLEVTNLSVTFNSEAGPVTAVRNLSYEVRPGEVLGIVGESGSGKSVSSLAVMGLLPASAKVTGSVTFQGQELLGLDDRRLSQIRGRKISMVFQDPLSALTPVYTVGDQITEAIRVHQEIRKEAAWEQAVELLDLVGIPNPKQRARSFPHEFSGGMRQRVMIAMAIANDPDLIIADEPTTALDVTIQAQILEVLQTAKEAVGAAIIMITHDLGVIAGFADRMTVMYAGKPVETGQVDDVYYRPRMPYTLGLLGSIPRLDLGERQRLTPIEGTPPAMVDLPPGCPFAPRCPMRIDVCEQTEPELVLMPASGNGHHAACHRSAEIEQKNLASTEVFPTSKVDQSTVAALPRQERPSVLEVRDLVREYPMTKGVVLRRQVGTVRAVSGISFDIREGETLGLVGESGCGKTTTIMEILELAKPMAGSIVVLGKDTATMSRQERFAIRRDLQVVFQDPMASLDPRLPISEIISQPLATHGVPPEQRQRRVRELLRLVGLRPEHADRYPAKFSGGQRQRIGIARALALEPKLLVLDEPVSALDVSIQAGVINLLEELKVKLGLSYLFVAHDLSVVRHIADRVAVMYLGRIVEIGETDRVFDSPSHPYTQALLSAIPLPDPEKERRRQRIVLSGDLPSPADPPSGCQFRTRCQKFAHDLDEDQRQRCLTVSPELGGKGVPGADHEAACHFAAAASVI